jgi:beta-lactam-binding protein with PASTA domain
MVLCMVTLMERVLAVLGLGKEDRGPVEVPRVTGLRVETARQRCLEDGLLFAIDDPVPHPRVIVVAQSPAAGSSVEQYTTVWVRTARRRPRWHPRPLRWWVRKVLDWLPF